MLRQLWWKLVRFGFRLLYYEMAWTYDFVSRVVSLGQWRCWQRTTFDYLPKTTDTVLELAHGTGNLQIDLSERGYHSIGYDLSPYMGKITTRKLQKKNITSQLARGQAQQLPFANSSFSAVVSTFPTDFIIAPETINEVYRVLQVDGVFVVVLNGILTGKGVIKPFLDWLYRITGQSKEGQQSPSALSYFEGYGFHVEFVEVACSNSQAQLIVALKGEHLLDKNIIAKSRQETDLNISHS